MAVSEVPSLVGSAAHCGLVIDDPSVSSSHAEVVRRDGAVVVRDLNSTNGTTVDGQRVESEAVLPPGGSVTFGLVTYVLNGSELVESQGVGHTQMIGGTAASSMAAPPPPPPLLSPSGSSSSEGSNKTTIMALCALLGVGACSCS